MAVAENYKKNVLEEKIHVIAFENHDFNCQSWSHIFHLKNKCNQQWVSNDTLFSTRMKFWIHVFRRRWEGGGFFSTVLMH